MSSKKTSRKKHAKVKIKTGDGKTLAVDQNIGKISKKLAGEFEKSDEVYYENVSEAAVDKIAEYYDIQLGFTEAQREKFGDPDLYKDKLTKRLRDSDSDKELVELYLEYKNMPPGEFFEFMKAAWDMQIPTLIDVCSHITANMISGKSISRIERMLCKVTK